MIQTHASIREEAPRLGSAGATGWPAPTRGWVRMSGSIATQRLEAIVASIAVCIIVHDLDDNDPFARVSPLAPPQFSDANGGFLVEIMTIGAQRRMYSVALIIGVVGDVAEYKEGHQRASLARLPNLVSSPVKERSIEPSSP